MNSKKKGGESIPGTGPVFEKQALHWGILGLLLLVLYEVSRREIIREGSLWGLSSVQWLWISAGLAAALVALTSAGLEITSAGLEMLT